MDVQTKISKRSGIMSRYSPIVWRVYVSLFVFYVAAMVDSVVKGNWEGALLSLTALILLNLPCGLERILKFRFPTAMMVLTLLFTTGPVLGNVYGLYFKFTLWDKVVHTLCGFVFAGFGYVLPQLTDRQHRNTPGYYAVCVPCA